MKELRLKIKRENYNLFKELTDKQAGELIKGMCAYMYDCKPFGHQKRNRRSKTEFAQRQEEC